MHANTAATSDVVEDPPDNKIGFCSLMFVIYFLVCGGAYGSEDLGSTLPPLYSLLGILLCPWLFGFPLALLTAELATSMPDDEGFMLWTERAWGPALSFFVGWNIMCIVMIDQALYPILFLSYLQSLVEVEFSWGLRFGVCLAFVAFSLFVTLVGTRFLSVVTNLSIVAVLVPLIIYCSLCYASTDIFTPSNWLITEGHVDLQLYSSVLLWLYSGYDFAGFLANDTKDAHRTFPRAIISAIFVSMLTYLIPISASLALTTDPEYFTDGSFTIIASEILTFGQWLPKLIVVGAMFSNAGSYLAYLHTSATGLTAMSEKGDAPRFLSAKLRYFDTPWASLCVFSLTTLLWTQFDFSIVVEVETVLMCLHYFLLILTFLKLRFTSPDLPRPFRVPGHNVVLAIFSLIPASICVLNVVFTGWFEISLGSLLIIFIWTCYFSKTQVQRCLNGNREYENEGVALTARKVIPGDIIIDNGS
jgi:amino acid transporter